MKPARSIGKARNARLNQTIKHATALLDRMLEFQGTPHDTPITDAEFWEEGREFVELIGRSFHEANAYNNCMVPDNTTFERDVYSTDTMPEAVPTGVSGNAP